jgi:hypothetical protein
VLFSSHVKIDDATIEIKRVELAPLSAVESATMLAVNTRPLSREELATGPEASREPVIKLLA